LDPSLHIAHIMSQCQTPAAACTSCNEVDHHSEDCALAPLHPKSKAPGRSLSSREWPSPYPRQLSANRTSRRPFLVPRPPRICLSCHNGSCKYPGACNFAHICATCKGDHQARICSQTPLESGSASLHAGQLFSHARSKEQ